MNKHKPWIETSYHGVITENTDVVLLDPPLVALDKDAPVPYAGTWPPPERDAATISIRRHLYDNKQASDFRSISSGNVVGNQAHGDRGKMSPPLAL